MSSQSGGMLTEKIQVLDTALRYDFRLFYCVDCKLSNLINVTGYSYIYRVVDCSIRVFRLAWVCSLIKL